MTVKSLAEKMVTDVFTVSVEYLYMGKLVTDECLTVQQFVHDYKDETITYIVNRNGQLVVGIK